MQLADRLPRFLKIYQAGGSLGQLREILNVVGDGGFIKELNVLIVESAQMNSDHAPWQSRTEAWIVSAASSIVISLTQLPCIAPCTMLHRPWPRYTLQLRHGKKYENE